MLSGAGNYLITDSSEDTDPASTIILNATDSSQTDAGGDLLNEEHGNNNTIILDGTDSDFERIILNGTDSDSTDAGENIRLEGGDSSDGVVLNEDSDTDREDVNAKLLQDVDAADGVVALAYLIV